MVAHCKGRCMYVAEPKKFKDSRGVEKVKTDFHFLMEVPNRPPEMVKVASFNGFKAKVGDVVEFDASIRASLFQGKVYLNVEVL